MALFIFSRPDHFRLLVWLGLWAIRPPRNFEFQYDCRRFDKNEVRRKSAENCEQYLGYLRTPFPSFRGSILLRAKFPSGFSQGFLFFALSNELPLCLRIHFDSGHLLPDPF